MFENMLKKSACYTGASFSLYWNLLYVNSMKRGKFIAVVDVKYIIDMPKILVVGGKKSKSSSKFIDLIIFKEITSVFRI